MSTYSTESGSDATLPGPDYTSSTSSDRREESNIPPQPTPPRFGMFGPVAPSHTPQERDVARPMLELRNPVVHGANNTSGTTNGNQDSDSGSSPGPEIEPPNASGDGGECAAPNSAQTPTTTSGSAPSGNTSTTSAQAATSATTHIETTSPKNDGALTVTRTSMSTTDPVTANPPASANNLTPSNATPATASTGISPAPPATGPAASQGSRTITVSQYHAMMRARAARQ